MTSTLQLVVLRSQNVDKLKLFYETIGLSFVHEKHGNGPLHYSCTMGELVLELYPTMHDADTAGIGFCVSDIEQIIASVQQEYIYQHPIVIEHQKRAVLRDPDGRAVYLWEKSCL